MASPITPPSNKGSILSQLDDALPDDKETPEPKTPVVKEDKEDTPDDEEEPVETGEDEAEETEGEEDKISEDEEEVETASEPKAPSLVTRAKTKYPGLFKEFPELKEAYFQYQEIKQIYGSVEEAREASERVEVMDNLANELGNGNIEPLMDTVYEQDPEALKAMVFSFLPTLQKKSSKLFNAVMTPVISNVFARIAKTAMENENEDLLLAVRYCTRAIGLGTDIPRPVKVGIAERNTELDAERSSLVEQKEAMFYDACESRTDPVLDKEIVDGLDPDGVLPEGLREVTIEKIRKDVYLALKDNTSYMRMMMALRRSAAANGYNKEYQKKVSREVIKAAKEVIPAIRAKYKKRMLGNLVKDGTTAPTKSIPNSSGNTSTVGGNKKTTVDADKINWKTTSMRDALDKAL